MYLTAVMRSYRAFFALLPLWIIVVIKTETDPYINWTFDLFIVLTSETECRFELGLQILDWNGSSCMKH